MCLPCKKVEKICFKKKKCCIFASPRLTDFFLKDKIMFDKIICIRLFRRVFARWGDLIVYYYTAIDPRTTDIFCEKRMESYASFGTRAGESPIARLCTNTRLAFLGKNDLEICSLPAGVPFRNGRQ